MKRYEYNSQVIVKDQFGRYSAISMAYPDGDGHPRFTTLSAAKAFVDRNPNWNK